MPLNQLTQGDFEFYKRYSLEMIKLHEQEFMRVIDPNLIRALYRGRDKKDFKETDSQGYWSDKEHYMALSKVFQTANTILPNLYYQNPSPIITPLRNSDADQAALMTAILKHYMKLNHAKQQNQEAIMNALFFGIGWKKIGYRTVFLPRDKSPESKLEPSVIDKIRGGFRHFMGMGEDHPQADNTESRETPDLVDYETLFNDSESPLNIMVDHQNDLNNSRAILHRMKRTLYDVMVSGNYDDGLVEEMAQMLRRKNGTRFDDREIELDLNELHVMQRNGVWILTWVDQFNKALRYDKSGYGGKGFLFVPITFTNEPGIRYPISHMKVAAQAQIKLNDLASLYVETIARSKNIIALNEKALSPGQVSALEQNLVQGILKFQKDITPNVLQSFTSSPVSNDLINLMAIVQQNITEIMGSDEQLVSGQSKNRTLGQDELARMGTKVRQTGMTDKVSDWFIEQLRREGTLIKQYSDSELYLQITGEDYTDPQKADRIEAQWASFMTEQNPLGAKHYLQGEFEYDCNIEDAIKPNKASQQQSYQQLLLAATNPMFAQSLMPHFRIRTDLIFKAWLETFDGIGNPDRFLEELTSMQAAAMQTQAVLMQQGLPTPPKIAGVSNGTPQPSGNSSQGMNPQTEIGVTAPSSVIANQ